MLRLAQERGDSAMNRVVKDLEVYQAGTKAWDGLKTIEET